MKTSTKQDNKNIQKTSNKQQQTSEKTKKKKNKKEATLNTNVAMALLESRSVRARVC